jgi:hypothetical protein
MNLFVTDICPVKSAHALDNKRVGKMLMECNQMMSLAIKECDPFGDWECGAGLLTAGHAHRNHPVSIWVRENISNFEWCLNHAYALIEEFKLRFDKEHASGLRTPYIASKKNCLPLGDLLPFQNSARNVGMGVDYSDFPVPVSYQKYLIDRWENDKLPVRFTTRGPPEWLTQ